MINFFLRSWFVSFFVNCINGPIFHRFFGLGRVLSNCGIKEVGKIFELGCGVGVTTQLIARRWPGADILAVDKDSEKIKSAQKRFSGRNEKVLFECADILNMNLPAATYDVVVSSLVLHHIKEYEKAFATLARSVKPGGLLIIYDIPENTAVRLARCRFPSEGVFSADELRALAVKNGCTIEVSFGRQRIYLIARVAGNE